MIGTLRGTLASKGPEGVVIDVAGVGYEVSMPASSIAGLPPEGREAFLYIYTHVRDDAIVLYGFMGEEGKRIFTTLIGISGIGPKMALSVLSGLSHDDFITAIDTEDVALLTRIPGLGKKTAHRLILELREKLPAREPAPGEGGEGEGDGDPIFNDSLSALINLGYKKSDASDALELASKKGYNTIEELLKEALRLLTTATGI